MNIQFNQEDLDILTEAKRLKDWHVLVTWKQRFMYQRYVALPDKDMTSVREIAAYAREILGKKEAETYEMAKSIFDDNTP